MSSALSLISLNIEGSKHLDLVLPFLRAREPDVVCLQELLSPDIPRFEQELGTSCFYSEMMNLPAHHPLSGRQKPVMMGVGIFSRFPVTRSVRHYYHRGGHDAFLFDETSTATKHKTQSCVLAVVEMEKDKGRYRIGTTHGTWIPDGQPDDFQRADTKALLEVLEQEGEIILCGDFNMPRGLSGQSGEMFGLLAARYKDNIPARYETSIDVNLHRRGKEHAHELSERMVDGLFTTPAYEASNVELVPGVSDHFAIVASVTTR